MWCGVMVRVDVVGKASKYLSNVTLLLHLLAAPSATTYFLSVVTIITLNHSALNQLDWNN